MAIVNNIKTASVAGYGRLPLAEKPGTFTPSGTKRDYHGGRLPGDGGHLDTSTPAKAELSINLIGGIDVAMLNNIVDQDVTITLADGQVHIMSQAFCTEPVATGDGETKLTLMSSFSEKI